MRNTLKNVAIVATAILWAACNNDDSVITNPVGTGNLAVEFDNSFAGNEFVLNAENGPTATNEMLRINTVKYIISNIVLYTDQGAAYTYPKAQSYFIVDESEESSLVLDLHNIPAANYVRIKFGIGVDQAQWEAGEANQGDFFVTAHNAGMLEDWDSGYKFLSVAGSFTSPSVTTQSDFSIRTGKTAAAYNYREVTLDLPQQALVRTTITPEIHIIADLSKIVSGGHDIALSTQPVITDGAAVAEVAENTAAMFSVAHVHND